MNSDICGTFSHQISLPELLSPVERSLFHSSLVKESQMQLAILPHCPLRVTVLLLLRTAMHHNQASKLSLNLSAPGLG